MNSGRKIKALDLTEYAGGVLARRVIPIVMATTWAIVVDQIFR